MKLSKYETTLIQYIGYDRPYSVWGDKYIKKELLRVNKQYRIDPLSLGRKFLYHYAIGRSNDARPEERIPASGILSCSKTKKNLMEYASYSDGIAMESSFWKILIRPTHIIIDPKKFIKSNYSNFKKMGDFFYDEIGTGFLDIRKRIGLEAELIIVNPKPHDFMPMSVPFVED